MKKVDYSSEAITRRLRQTEQLRRLSLSLMKAKRIHDGKAREDSVKKALPRDNRPENGVD